MDGCGDWRGCGVLVEEAKNKKEEEQRMFLFLLFFCFINHMATDLVMHVLFSNSICFSFLTKLYAFSTVLHSVECAKKNSNKSQIVVFFLFLSIPLSFHTCKTLCISLFFVSFVWCQPRRRAGRRRE